MHPIIFKIGPFTIYSFGLMLAVAVLLCSYLLARDARSANIPRDVIYDFILWMTLSGIIGSRLFFILLNLPDFIADPGQIIMIQNGGLAWQGGLAAGAIAGVIYARKKDLSLRLLADLSAPYLALGQAIGRVGCFLNGCCYGQPVPWGIYFPVHDARLHPTQLYDVAMLTAVFFLLKYFQKRSKIRGEVFTAYLVFASIERFINEFFRADHSDVIAGLSVFQIVSLVIFMAGIYLWRRLHRRAG